MPETPVVFISHDTRDAELAAAFSDLLRNINANELTPFCSSDTEETEGIPYGKDWYKELLARATLPTLFVYLTKFRPWIIYEASLARGQADIPICALYLGVPQIATALSATFKIAMTVRLLLPNLCDNYAKRKTLRPLIRL